MARRIILDRRIVEDDWQHLADEDPVPAEGDITVSLNRWQEEQDKLRQHPGKLGLRLDNDIPVEEYAEDIKDKPLTVIDFPIIETKKRGYHPDGRAYSQAYVLRTRLGYKGEIRATGAGVMRDVLLYMSRCGINAFEVVEDKDINDALKAFNEMTVAYQPSADEIQPAFLRRRNEAA